MKRRALLSKEYDSHPNDLRLALKIKAIDDQIADCTEQLVKEKRLVTSSIGILQKKN